MSIWDIKIHCEDGDLLLTDGGARWFVDGAPQPAPALGRHHEYVGVYAAFAECIRAGRSDCDLRPLELVADVFMNGRRRSVAPFSF